MSQRLHTVWTAIYDVLTVNYNARELFTVLAWLAYTWSVLRLLAFLLAIPHIPKVLSMSVLESTWLVVLFVVSIVMRRTSRKGK